MEMKPVKSKNNGIIYLLSKYASFSIPHSPIQGKGSQSKAKFKKIPREEALDHKKKNNLVEACQEPNSPKISCMGQIKKNKMMSKRSASFNVGKRFSQDEKMDQECMKVNACLIRAPTVGEMRRFSSGRESLKDFDWKDHGKLGMDSRKEVNIWKRRTMAPITPLQLN